MVGMIVSNIWKITLGEIYEAKMDHLDFHLSF
jgi:hypothetical protein